MQRIFLIGLMGSGKSYWGERIAKHLGWNFIDLDAQITTGEGKTIAEIFEKDGEAYFRLLEKKYLEGATAMHKVVVATGGGTPCFNGNMQLMNQSGKTYYLKAGIETLVERVQHETNTRPLLKGKTKKELPAFFAKQLKQREPFYLQASVTIEVEKLREENLSKIFKRD